MNLLTTLRKKDGAYSIDITIADDGSVAKSVGVTADIDKARRWERFILISWRMWWAALAHNRGRVNQLMRRMYDECQTTDHDAWMAAHPLPEVVS